MTSADFTTTDKSSLLINELQKFNLKLQLENQVLRNQLKAAKFKETEQKRDIPLLAMINEHTKLNITVFGGGSFGTAMATIAARKGHNVIIFTRNLKKANAINSEHINIGREWLTKYTLHKNISATTDIHQAVDKSTHIIIHCVPTQATPDFLLKYAQFIPKHIVFVNTAKGIHLKSEKLLSFLIPECLNRTNVETERITYLSGPSFAKEMMSNHPISLVLAGHDKRWCKYIQTALNSLLFRVYITTDVIGVECGGALKNPLAIGAGIACGIGYGQSTLAAMITRGTVEMQRLAVALGGKPETLVGLSGYGDLMLTCFCSLSRNRTCGFYMGSEGLSVADAQLKVGETVEGVATAIVAQKLMLKYGLRMPLFDAIADIMQGKLQPRDALKLVGMKQPDEEGFILMRPSIS